MPCVGFSEPNKYQVEISKVAALLEELGTGKLPNFYGKGEFFPPDVIRLNTETAKLCAILQNCDVGQYSLEMQLWWKDHQAEDEKRIKRELEEKNIALSKLTPYERKLLGF